MALKIVTRAKDMPEAKKNVGSNTHTKWKRTKTSKSIKILKPSG